VGGKKSTFGWLDSEVEELMLYVLEGKTPSRSTGNDPKRKRKGSRKSTSLTERGGGLLRIRLTRMTLFLFAAVGNEKREGEKKRIRASDLTLCGRGKKNSLQMRKGKGS